MKTLKKNCIISAVGKNSLHHEWIKGNSTFDLHLIVYDDSYDLFCKDTEFICSQKGYKLRLVYNYLLKNPEYLEKYEYFFLPDDDIQMDATNISKLFQLMENYQLQIAQPGLTNSYYTHDCFLRDKFCLLRYTNFVEMMLPCFSQEALKKVLPTFNANRSGWGTDYHWSKLIHFTGKEMAIIDELHAIHTRIIQSHNPENQKEFDEYTQIYKLNQNFMETGFIPIDFGKIKSDSLIPDRKTDKQIKNIMEAIDTLLTQLIYFLKTSPSKIGKAVGISLFFIHYSHISEKRKHQDTALKIVEMIGDKLEYLKKDLSFNNGIPGFSWYIEYLAQHGFIENNTDEILEIICEYLNHCILRKRNKFDINGLLQIIPHYIARISNPHFNTNTKLHNQEKEILIKMLQKIHQWSQNLSISKENININNLIHCILLLCQTKKAINTPEIESTLQRLILILERSPISTQLPYLLKTYLLILSSKVTNNESFNTETIRKALNYKDYQKDTDYQKLLNIYLLHKIYLLTKEEMFKIDALKTLHSFTKKNQTEKTSLNLLTNNLFTKGDNSTNLNKWIRTGLILISILSEKDTEIDLHIF